MPPNAPRLSCAARARGRTEMIAGAQLYVGAQMEFCQGRAAQLQPLVRQQAYQRQCSASHDSGSLSKSTCVTCGWAGTLSGEISPLPGSVISWAAGSGNSNAR